jgi:large subunit ribosomal protein L21
MATYAIISVGGKQYRVREGERLLVDRLQANEGKTFHPDVLFSGGDGDATLAPRIQVIAKVVGHVRGERIRIGKRRPKTGYRRQTGFRAHLSQIEIESIGAATRGVAAEKEPAAPTAKVERKEPGAAQPPRGYADLTVADIGERAKRWKVDQLEAALEFELTNANRKGAITALEAAIAVKEQRET